MVQNENYFINRNQIVVNPAQEKYLKDIRNNWKIKLFFLKKLPSLVFWGCKVTHLDKESCSATLPYGWRTQNPFGSIYFAAQAGVAEISTGSLCQLALQGKGRWSMYVTGFRAEYGVTAKSKVTFTCNDGSKIVAMIDQIEKNGVPDDIEVLSTGTNEEDQIVSKFYITWSFKKKG